MYIPDKIFNINEINEMRNFLHNRQELTTIIISIVYLIFLSLFIVILLIDDIIKYNQYTKITDYIYKTSKKNDDFKFRLY